MASKLFMQDGQTVVYCKGSDTIRIKPNNYCLMSHRSGSWEMFPDAAAPLAVVVAATAAVMVHSLRWGSGEAMAQHINDVLPLYQSHNMMAAIEAIDGFSLGNKISVFGGEQR